jgi:hypothetical protein
VVRTDLHQQRPEEKEVEERADELRSHSVVIIGISTSLNGMKGEGEVTLVRNSAEQL